jgi:hypothetical protein
VEEYIHKYLDVDIPKERQQEGRHKCFLKNYYILDFAHYKQVPLAFQEELQLHFVEEFEKIYFGAENQKISVVV